MAKWTSQRTQKLNNEKYWTLKMKSTKQRILNTKDEKYRTQKMENTKWTLDAEKNKEREHWKQWKILNTKNRKVLDEKYWTLK
jgi:hypothetical protein